MQRRLLSLRQRSRSLPHMVKLGIILFLVFIVYNLGAGCYHMLTNKEGSDKVVRSLSWRIGLSILLIILIMLGIKFGIISPHDVLTPR